MTQGVVCAVVLSDMLVAQEPSIKRCCPALRYINRASSGQVAPRDIRQGVATGPGTAATCWSIQTRQYPCPSQSCRQQTQTRSGIVTDSYQTDMSITMSTNFLLIQAKIGASVSCFTGFQICGEFHAHLGCAAAGYGIVTEISCSTPLGTAGDIKSLH